MKKPTTFKNENVFRFCEYDSDPNVIRDCTIHYVDGRRRFPWGMAVFFVVFFMIYFFGMLAFERCFG